MLQYWAIIYRIMIFSSDVNESCMSVDSHLGSDDIEVFEILALCRIFMDYIWVRLKPPGCIELNRNYTLIDWLKYKLCLIKKIMSFHQDEELNPFLFLTFIFKYVGSRAPCLFLIVLFLGLSKFSFKNILYNVGHTRFLCCFSNSIDVLAFCMVHPKPLSWYYSSFWLLSLFIIILNSVSSTHLVGGLWESEYM